MAFGERFSFLMGISMGKWPDFEYHVGKWLKYDRSGYNSSHPSLGSPLDLGNPWRPLATLGGPWRHAWKWPISPKENVAQLKKKVYCGTPYCVLLHTVILSPHTQSTDQITVILGFSKIKFIYLDLHFTVVVFDGKTVCQMLPRNCWE